MPKKQIGKKIDEQGNLTDLGYTVTQEEINDWNNKVDKSSYQEITGQKVFNKPIRTGHANSENDFRMGIEIDPAGVITCKNDMDGANFRTRVKIPTIEETRIDINLPQKSGTIATLDDIPTNTSQLTNSAGFINKDVNNLTNYTLAVNTASGIEMSIDDSTYVVSLKLKNAEGTQLGDTQTIDLPLESVVVNGAYDSNTKEVVLTLDNGSEIRFSVADLVSGLQNEITTTNKLSSDLVDDTNSTNKFVTLSEKETWNNKANTSDIPTNMLTTSNYSTTLDSVYAPLSTKVDMLGNHSGILYKKGNNSLIGFSPMGAANGLQVGSLYEKLNLLGNEDRIKYYSYLDGAPGYKSKTIAFTSDIPDLLSKIYPVGSIYMSVNSTSPASFLGGTWEQLKDRFLLGAGDTYSNGVTGGEASHTLTIDELPSHKHDGLYWHNDMTNIGASYDTGSGNGWQLSGSWVSTRGGNNFKTAYAGGGAEHNNMPPYLAVYMWKRTA